MVGSGFDICFTIVALMFLCTIFALDSLEQRHQHHRNHQNHPKHLLHDFVGYQDWNRKLIHIDELTADAISSILDSELHQNTMYVLIKTPTNQTIEVVTAELDKFVVSRPWWMVELEPYSWHIQSHEQNSIWDIVLLRIPSEHLEIFKAFAQNNFASPEHCAKLPLIVSNHDGDAWGNRLSNVQSEWDGKSGAIFYVRHSKITRRCCIHHSSLPHRFIRHMMDLGKALFLLLRGDCVPTASTNGNACSCPCPIALYHHQLRVAAIGTVYLARGAQNSTPVRPLRGTGFRKTENLNLCLN